MKLIEVQNLMAALPINLIFWITVASVCLWVVRELWVRVANVDGYGVKADTCA